MKPPSSGPDQPRWRNRLADAASPYLRQHGHDPVDWLPWGEEAFRRAREEDRPVFLSIGYAACHWCHVMQQESFSDPVVAAILNSHFVPIKVDREERPDVDAIYIEALLSIQGQAGWPATLFLLPSLRPFTGATYLPPAPRYGLPSFRQVLERVRGLWKGPREAVEAAGANLARELSARPAPGPLPNGADVERQATALVEQVDRDEGGFGHGQKFPHSPALEVLLLHAASGHAGAESALTRTLDAMADGGLWDALGGGFHRYCVDDDWTVPHFEKMLYDNGQLLRVYARDSARWVGGRPRSDTQRVRARIRIAEETAAYLLGVLRDPSGLFCAAEDADDEGGEGAFYTFTRDEAREALGPFAKDPLPYGLSGPSQTEDGRHVLLRRLGEPDDAARSAMRAYRDRRPRPARIDTRIVAWNGLVIGALAEAGRLFDRAAWVEVAEAAASAALPVLRAGGRVAGGDAPAVLSDYADLADGLVWLHQAAPRNPRWLVEATALTREALTRFDAGDGGLFESVPRADLVADRVAARDLAEPSGYGRLVAVVRRLLALGADLPRDRVDRALLAVIAADGDDAGVQRLLRAWNRRWRPEGLVAVLSPGHAHGALAVGKVPGPGGKARAYVCRAETCSAPVDDADALAVLLDGSP